MRAPARFRNYDTVGTFMQRLRRGNSVRVRATAQDDELRRGDHRLPHAGASEGEPANFLGSELWCELHLATSFLK